MHDTGKPPKAPLTAREYWFRIAVVVAATIVVGLAVWVIFFYGSPDNAGTVPH